MDTIESRNAYQLARLADVPSPDSLHSAGALFLRDVQDAALENLASEERDDEDAEETATRLANECVETLESRGTYGKWLAFVDLCAWQEDIADLVGPVEDMNKGADVALYIIAERLALALLTGEDDGS